MKKIDVLKLLEAFRLLALEMLRVLLATLFLVWAYNRGVTHGMPVPPLPRAVLWSAGMFYGSYLASTFVIYFVRDFAQLIWILFQRKRVPAGG